MDLDIYIPLIYVLDSSLSIPLIYAIEIGASTGIYDFPPLRKLVRIGKGIVRLAVAFIISRA